MPIWTILEKKIMTNFISQNSLLWNATMPADLIYKRLSCGPDSNIYYDVYTVNIFN